MFNQITSDPAILGGKPIIQGTRISLAVILEWIASGASRGQIVQNYPHLTTEAVEQAIADAASSLKNDVVLTAEVKL